MFSSLGKQKLLKISSALAFGLILSVTFSSIQTAHACGKDSIQEVSPDQFLTPTPGTRKTEVLVLLDTTGSMTYPVSASNLDLARHQLVHDTMHILIERLKGSDSAGKKEEAGGGLRTVSFAGGKARDLDDINLTNFEEVWSKLEWDNSTHILPGWRQLVSVFREEFEREKEIPIPFIVVITDGVAEDLEQFESVLKLNPSAQVVIALLGDDQLKFSQNETWAQDGVAHERALRELNALAKGNSNVHVVPFTGVDNAQNIASSLLERIPR